MAHYTYYCEVTRRRNDVESGVYKIVADNSFMGPWFPKLNRLMSFSEYVWKEGPRGGIKISKAPWNQLCPMGYVAKDSEWMKRFFWTKLKAKTL